MQFGRLSERIGPRPAGGHRVRYRQRYRPHQGKWSGDRNGQTGCTTRRKPSSNHLLREDVVLDVEDRVCVFAAGRCMPWTGVSEMLD
jgi:hypothetical protein